MTAPGSVIIYLFFVVTLFHFSSQKPAGSGILMEFLKPSIVGMKEPENKRKQACAEKSGTLVRNECYKFSGKDVAVTFDEAREMCKSQGGFLWTPPFDDPSFFHDLFEAMPEVAGSTDFKGVFIGAITDSEGRAKTIDGFDITNEFLIQLSAATADDGLFEPDFCLRYNFRSGAFYTLSGQCSSPDTFLCEFPLLNALESDSEITINKNIFNWG